MQKILDTALEVIDEVGIDKFSVHRVARELGVQGPSIYYYFADREVLIASVCLRLLQEVHVPRRRPGDWGARLIQDALLYYRALREHPNLATALLVERKTRAGAAARFEDALAQLSAVGISPTEGLALIDVLEGIALSWITFQHAASVAIDRTSFPTLAMAVQREKFDEASLKRIITALIDGVRLQHENRSASQPAESKPRATA
ncbi:regulatory protein TetR [Mycolicibacterium rhodesiae JS60]|nr:regulatory protein TetR [Mycolicibacterium rhodesiae JS60]